MTAWINEPPHSPSVNEQIAKLWHFSSNSCSDFPGTAVPQLSQQTVSKKGCIEYDKRSTQSSHCADGSPSAPCLPLGVESPLIAVPMERQSTFAYRVRLCKSRSVRRRHGIRLEPCISSITLDHSPYTPEWIKRVMRRQVIPVRMYFGSQTGCTVSAT
jgi:hypothetical protein